jgi:hypothetical protein
MKKTYQIKRTEVQTKKGTRVYYFQDGKRIKDSVGRRKYVKQNYQRLDKPYSKAPKNLTADEIKSFNRSKAQKELYRYKGKPVDRFMVELLKGRGLIRRDDKERNILKLTNQDGSRTFTNYGRFEQAFEIAKDAMFNSSFESQMGAEGYRGRVEKESIMSIAETLQNITKGGWNLEVVSEGQVAYGYEGGLDMIRSFEENQTDRLVNEKSNVAAVRFRYRLEYDPKSKIVTIFLDDTRIEEMQSI